MLAPRDRNENHNGSLFRKCSDGIRELRNKNGRVFEMTLMGNAM